MPHIVRCNYGKRLVNMEVTEMVLAEDRGHKVIYCTLTDEDMEFLTKEEK